MDSKTKPPPQHVFICFFIVRLQEDGTFTREWTYPKDGCTDKEFKQYQNFCFPIAQTGNPNDLKSQHFTFMLTDIETNRKYGFCKMIDSNIANGKLCYCFLSEYSWFEIFYKCLNCVCTVHMRNDINTLHSIIEKFYQLPIPKANEIVSLSTSLTFSVPDETALPSIPENRNMMEYLSAINTKNMIDIYAAFMFERRIIFTSSNLSVISGCIFASESLLQPLAWQHIFIPLLHRHIIDYCTAPMPFIIGMHSSLYKTIEGTQTIDGVVVVNIDENVVYSPYDDTHKLPGDALSYLRSQLGKPNVSVGSNLSHAFLRTQATLFGGYRAALRFRMGETISFHEDKFISSFKPGGRRSFAEELIHLQSFRQFIDHRLHVLNKGIGFHDSFEKEVSELHEETDYATMYKEWISRKRTEMLYDIKTNMKNAKSSAKQSMKDMKNAWKSTPKDNITSREHSLRENISSARPPRPPRPPPPQKKTVTRFKMIDSDEPDIAKKPEPVHLDAPTKTNINELLIDLSFDPSSVKDVESPNDASQSWIDIGSNMNRTQSGSGDDWAQEIIRNFDQSMSPIGGSSSTFQIPNGFQDLTAKSSSTTEASVDSSSNTNSADALLISFD